MALFAAGVPPINSTTGQQTDPSTSAILAELTATEFGSTRNGRLYNVYAYVGGSTGQVWQLELASSSNVNSTSVLEATFLRHGAGFTSQFAKRFKVDGDQRIRLRHPSSLSGTFEGKLQAEELA